MQIIQTIRDKGAAVVIAVIALSLIGFLLMDAKSGSKGGGGFLNSLNSSVGKVNGVAIEKAEFEQKVKTTEANSEKQQQQYQRKPSAGEIRDQVWQGMVFQTIFTQEAQKLGIGYSSGELSSLFYSNSPENPFLQGGGGTFIDPATGKLDPLKVTQKISEMKKAKGDEAESYNQFTEQLRMQNMQQKYYALLNASAYYPTWMQETDKEASKNFASISYVAVPYSVISDSTITVSDNEISNYIDKHKKLFKQEEGRMISYVSFSQSPSAADSARTKQSTEALKAAMATETNMAGFTAKNLSTIPFDSLYLPKSKITSPVADTLTKLPVGTVYGPYVDRGSYVLAKIVDTKVTPDSAKARHILIPLADPQTGQPIPDSVAKKQADSILAAINGGADFAALAKQYSSDPGSKDKGGFYDFFEYGKMTPEFNDFAFNKPAGTRGIVKTSYGYHIMEAMGQKGSSTKYKIAYVGQEIIQSPETVGQANNNATRLSGEKSGKEMDAYIAKNGLQKITWPSPLKENDFQLGQLEDARALVKWVFDAKEGDVSDVFNINGQFIVAILDKVQNEGTADVKSARRMVEGVIRNQKKAEAISKNLAANPTLDGAAAFYKVMVKTAGQDSSLVFNSAFIKEIGEEPKLIGASFNKDYQTKVSAPIVGNNGVYIIKVNSVGTKADITPEAAAAQITQQITTLRNQAGSGWYEGLKSQATIKDNRSKYY